MLYSSSVESSPSVELRDCVVVRVSAAECSVPSVASNTPPNVGVRATRKGVAPCCGVVCIKLPLVGREFFLTIMTSSRGWFTPSGNQSAVFQCLVVALCSCSGVHQLASTSGVKKLAGTSKEPRFRREVAALAPRESNRRRLCLGL